MTDLKLRQTVLKTVLWAIVGVLAVVTVSRFLRGLGATTALTDATPWGFWIAFDVMAGVALAAGGFVLAATVYIFGRSQYKPFARPAILTAFLGYAAVAVALLYDLGLPWHIWHPMVYPQFHSVLFEVAMCVILYLNVLALEFAPVVLEHKLFDKPLFHALHRVLKKATLPLVIAGIVLSTLHQSSLGSLFLIQPYRLHALWYSPIIWVLFFVSAIGLGLSMVIAESFFSAWFFGHKLKMGPLSGLGRAASVVLLVYATLRLGDLGARGALGQAFAGSWQANLFLFELVLTAIIPASLLLFRRIRTHPAGLLSCAVMTIFGVIGYRFNVCIVAFTRPDEMPYFPSWMELSVSLGVVAGAVLVFSFMVEHLNVYPEDDHEATSEELSQLDLKAFDPASLRPLLPTSLASPRRYTLAFVAAAALTLALLPEGSLFGDSLPATPVAPARTLDGFASHRNPHPGFDYRAAKVGDEVPPSATPLRLVMIDGNRDGRLVLFPHDQHAKRLEQHEGCGGCHHQNKPFDRETSCYECHRDMYVTTDIFHHGYHVARLEGNQGCAKCHADPSQPKTRQTATGCADCHSDMQVARTLVPPPEQGTTGKAPGYMDVMHRLCVDCHRENLLAAPLRYRSDLADCAACHREVPADQLHGMQPYAVAAMED